MGAATLHLSILQGRPNVLNFWVGLCPPCRAELPDLQDFHDDINDQVTVVSAYFEEQVNRGYRPESLTLLSDVICPVI